MNGVNTAASVEIVHVLSILSQAIGEHRSCAMAVVMLDPVKDPVGAVSIFGSPLKEDDVLKLLGCLFARLGTLADGYARSTADPDQFRLLLQLLVAMTPAAEATIILRQTPPAPPAPGETP